MEIDLVERKVDFAITADAAEFEQVKKMLRLGSRSKILPRFF
jgi:hypothetical protein